MKADLVLKAENSRFPTFSLAKGTFILGRSSKCDLVVKDDTVSRHHAEISVTKTTLGVLDLGSRNGTFIDSDRVQTAALRMGHQVRFGGVAFLLSLAEASPEGP